MKHLFKTVVMAAVLAIGSALPVMAQIVNGVDFTTSFPFYAQNTRLPAGSYKISQPDNDDDTLLIQSIDGKYAVFVDFVPTQSEQPHSQSDVTFHKYGNVDYLNRIWIVGQNYGMKVEATKTEKKAAAAQQATEHTVALLKH